MTKDQWKEGKKILDKIDYASSQKEKMKSIVERMDEVTTEYQETIEIRIAEQYMHTPVAEVSKLLFYEFIMSHIEAVNHEINALWEEFEKI